VNWFLNCKHKLDVGKITPARENLHMLLVDRFSLCQLFLIENHKRPNIIR